MYIRTRVHTYTPHTRVGANIKLLPSRLTGFPPPKHWQPNQHLVNLLSALTYPKVNT